MDKCGSLLRQTDLNKRGRIMITHSCAAIIVEAKVHFPVHYLTDHLKILP